MDADAIVLGAGISGLTTAHALARAGHRVLVLERRRAAGGRIHSERTDGYLFEHGPNGILSPAPEAEALIAELDLSSERIAREQTIRRRYLVRNGRAHALPLNPLALFLNGYLSLAARLRMLGEPFIARHVADETVARFARRRFGDEFLERVVDPLVGGLYAGDPENLSVTAVMPHLKRIEREAGSVIAALARARFSRRGNNPMDPRRRMLFSFREGMSAIPHALSRRLAGAVRYGVRAEQIRRAARGGFAVSARCGDFSETLRARTVVVALPAYAAASVLTSIAPELARSLRNIRYPPLAVALLGYRRGEIAHPLDGFGLLAPRSEGRDVLGMLFSSTLFAGRSPPGHVALSAYLGGARQPELALLPARELRERLHTEARSLLGARAQPRFFRVRYWQRGLPQPGLDHDSRLATLKETQAHHPGLFLAGNYLTGVSTAACIANAGSVARSADRFLRDPRIVPLRTGLPIAETTAEDSIIAGITR